MQSKTLPAAAAFYFVKKRASIVLIKFCVEWVGPFLKLLAPLKFFIFFASTSTTVNLANHVLQWRYVFLNLAALK
jgi:hypothetical protein